MIGMDAAERAEYCKETPISLTDFELGVLNDIVKLMSLREYSKDFMGDGEEERDMSEILLNLQVRLEIGITENLLTNNQVFIDEGEYNAS